MLGRRLLVCAIAVALLGGCIYRRKQLLSARLGRVAEAAGGQPSGLPRLLLYRVASHDGSWTHEVVMAKHAYAERRTRHDGARYAFGYGTGSAWLAVGDQPATAVDGEWAAQARTNAALHRLSFTRPGDGDEVEYMGRDRAHWELAYRPAGGKTMSFFIDRKRNVPREMDLVDEWTRIVSCDRLDWARSPDGAVLAGVRCGAGNMGGRYGDRAHQNRQLTSMQGLARLPSWAQPAELRRPAAFAGAVAVPIDDPRRIVLPVTFNDNEARPMVLDSGAFHTVLSEEVAREVGVVPTGEPPIFVDPPFLDKTTLWVGVVDKLQVGRAVVYGERVLVATNSHTLHPAPGLLGLSFFRNFVVDVDSPGETVRVWDRRAFRPAAEQRLVRLRGWRPRIDGEVVGVARGEIIVVSAPLMRVRHPRGRGTDAYLGAEDGIGASPDYYAELKGVRLGPFAFPRLDGVGRDRDRERLGSSIAIAGMGLMRYLRLSFDLKAGLLHVSVGDAYRALRRYGFDIEDGPQGVTLDRVLERSPAEDAGLRRGDVVIAIADQRVRDVRHARSLAAEHRGYFVKMLVERDERPITVLVDGSRPR